MSITTLVRPSVQRSLDLIPQYAAQAKEDLMDETKPAWEALLATEFRTDFGECYCGKPATSERGYCATCW